MSSSIEIQIIAIIVAVACALPGNFLILRKMSMMSDCITHTILFGIVLAFFIVQDLSSPLLMLGATAMGLFTVWLTELFIKTNLLAKDSAIGLVFPFLFSLAIILISKYASSVHLDTDAVLLGELAFTPFERMVIFGIDIGAKSIYTCGLILIINVLFINIFYKELKLATFDPLLAACLGFSPNIIHYALMTSVSITAVGAFESVGSILVVAFMIVPASTAYLLTDKLSIMIFLSVIFSSFSAIIGFQVAYFFDFSIAGSMAVVVGIIFLLTFILTKNKTHSSSF